MWRQWLDSIWVINNFNCLPPAFTFLCCLPHRWSIWIPIPFHCSLFIHYSDSAHGFSLLFVMFCKLKFRKQHILVFLWLWDMKMLSFHPQRLWLAICFSIHGNAYRLAQKETCWKHWKKKIRYVDNDSVVQIRLPFGICSYDNAGPHVAVWHWCTVHVCTKCLCVSQDIYNFKKNLSKSNAHLCVFVLSL